MTKTEIREQRVRRLIKVDGTVVPLLKPVTMAEIRTLINAGPKGLDSVNLMHLGQPLMVMVVDGSGYHHQSGPACRGSPVRRPLHDLVGRGGCRRRAPHLRTGIPQ